MSTYQPDSDVSKFNRSTSTEWFSVDPLTAQVVMRALEISRQTNGAFDITVGPAVDLWNFGAAESVNDLPSDQQIQAVLPLVGFSKIEARLDEELNKKKAK